MATVAVVAVAARQHGRVSSRQLAELGVSRDATRTLVSAGWLVPELRGAYRLGGAPQGLIGRCAAAVLAVDPAAGLTARTGLELRELLEPDPSRPVHLACDRHHRSRPGVIVHRKALATSERERIDGLRVASVTRCLVELATGADPATVEQAVHEAEFRRLLNAGELHRAARGRPQAALLRRLAADRLPIEGELRTELERRFAAFLLRHGFPVARTNYELILQNPRQRVVLDAVWFEAGLALELDGRQAHATARAFDADRERDRRLAVQFGLRVVRATWRQLEETEDALAADLRTLYKRGVAVPRVA